MIQFIESAVEPGATVHSDGWQAYWTVPDRGYEHERTIMRAQHDPAHVLIPGVHRVASLLKRWLLGTHQGSVGPEHLDAYLNEFTFRFNRRGSRRRGLLFYRLLEQAVITDPITYRSLICQPPPWRSTADATGALTGTTGRRAPMARPNLTQIDTPLGVIAHRRRNVGGAGIRIEPAIEVGNIFKLGTRYSEPLDLVAAGARSVRCQLVVLGEEGSNERAPAGAELAVQVSRGREGRSVPLEGAAGADAERWRDLPWRSAAPA